MELELLKMATSALRNVHHAPCLGYSLIKLILPFRDCTGYMNLTFPTCDCSDEVISSSSCDKFQEEKSVLFSGRMSEEVAAVLTRKYWQADVKVNVVHLLLI